MLAWKHRLEKISNYTSAIVVGLFIVLTLDMLISSSFGFSFTTSQARLVFALISFFSLVRAILSLNTDLSLGPKIKWKLLVTFMFWSAISFLTGFYASVSAIRIIDESIFPIVSFLAYVWKSYLLLFITCTNFIAAIFTFHRIANGVQIDTIEWFKRGFGSDGDPPRANLSPIAKKLLTGLILQLVLNITIYSYGSPELFFQAMSGYLHDILALVGFNLPVF